MKSYAQAGQDLWVFDLIGDHGFFVDVGAHDGIVHSNTYALEQLGWTGLCIEPNPVVFAELDAARIATCLNVAVAGHTGHVQMVGDRVVSFDRNGLEPLPCDTLPNLLEAAGAPAVIDYLSLDTEGCELQILLGMDFDRWDVRLMTVEHNSYMEGPARKDMIHELLAERGFERMVEDVVAPGYGVYEDWYAYVR